MAIISGYQESFHEKLYNHIGVTNGQYNWPVNNLIDLKMYSDDLSDLADGDIQLNLENGHLIFPAEGLDIAENKLNAAARTKRVLKDIYDKSQREGAQVETFSSTRIIE